MNIPKKVRVQIRYYSMQIKLGALSYETIYKHFKEYKEFLNEELTRIEAGDKIPEEYK